MTLENFWPLANDDHAGKCIFTEAETAPDAVFLAVHQPMKLMKKKYQSDDEAVSQDELQVFRDFVIENPPSGTVVMPIIGDSAVGKSHMVRWIDAHLRMSEHAEKCHIVRIPKSASMKNVLDLLLENLEGISYDKLKEDLNDAKLPDSPDQARLDLRSSLTGALERLVDDLSLAQKVGETSKEDIRRFSHARGLIHLLNDPGVQEFFLNRERDEGGRPGALTRIVNPLLQASHDVDNKRDNQFYIEDLDFVKKVEVAQLSPRSQTYFTRLSRDDQRVDAVDTLNELLDKALNRLIKFTGATLPEIFKKIRIGLFAEGKELILLIEDFAILGGIQQQLLDAVTDPATDSCCVMRTAIAVTEGRLDEATVLTRAGASWKIESQPFGDDKDAIIAFTNMVGGYLNAARHGAAELKRQFMASKNGEILFSNFFDIYGGELTEDEQKCLDAFGYSARGNYPLFPFNQNAIHQIMERNLKVRGKYQFKPRAMNRVIRNTVMNYREIWKNQQFPPATYENFSRTTQLGDTVNLHINRTVEPDRSGTLLGYWGDCPQTLSRAKDLSPEVYKAFSIAVIDWGNIFDEPEPPEPPGGERGDEVISRPPLGQITPSGWKECLVTWRVSKTLPQQKANMLRNWIGGAIDAWIDKDQLMLRELGVELPKLIFLPHAKTANPDVEKFHLITATEAQLNDPHNGPHFFLTMEAIIRFNERKNWDYDGGEIDCARYANFIERMANEVVDYLSEVGPRKLPTTNISPLVHSLMIGARILNLDKSSSSTFEDMIEALFDVGPPPNQTPHGQTTKWEDLKHAATQSRSEMRQLLLDHVAARQGGYPKEHAVDASILIPALKELKKQDWKIIEAADLSWRDSLTYSREHVQALKSRLPLILDEEKRIAQEWTKKIIGAFGEVFNIEDVAEIMRNTIKQALDCGAFRHRNSNDPKLLRDQIKTVRSMAVKSCFDDAMAAIEDNQTFGKRLSALARLDDRVMIKSRELIDDFERFLTETGEITEAKLVGAPDPKMAADLLLKQLENLESNWKQISEKINS